MAVVSVEIPARLTYEDGELTEITVNGVAWSGQNYIPAPYSVPCTIASGESVSSVIDLTVSAYRCPRLCAISVGDWTTAGITVLVSDAVDGTFRPLYDQNGNEYVVTVSADKTFVVTPADTIGFGFMKIRSGTAASPVNQAAERTLTLFLAQ